jgi:2-isopropylmalate synthase
VLINSTDGKREWGTVGVSENIIEASLQALVAHGVRVVKEMKPNFTDFTIDAN